MNRGATAASFALERGNELFPFLCIRAAGVTTLLDIHEKHSSPDQERQQDISSWRAVDVQRLNKRGRKHYYRRKAAITAYFTTNQPVEEIAAQHHLSAEQLLELAQQCLMRYEDGTPWGFRALALGTNVVDHQPSTQESKPIDASTNQIAVEPPSHQDADAVEHVADAGETKAADAQEMDEDDTLPAVAIARKIVISDSTDILSAAAQEPGIEVPPALDDQQ